MPLWVTILISCISDFVISAGGALTAAMVATGGATIMPSKAVALVAIITGAIAAARRVQALMAVPPAPPASAP